MSKWVNIGIAQLDSAKICICLRESSFLSGLILIRSLNNADILVGVFRNSFLVTGKWIVAGIGGSILLMLQLAIKLSPCSV